MRNTSVNAAVQRAECANTAKLAAHQQHACAHAPQSTCACTTQAPIAATAVSAVAAVAAHEDLRRAAAVVVLLQVLQRKSTAASEAMHGARLCTHMTGHTQQRVY
jgi:hypothetical protein